MTDWSKMARPQANGDDSRELLAMAQKRWGYAKPPACEPEFCGVRIRNDYPPGTMADGSGDDHVAEMERLIQLYPEGALCFRLLIDSVWLARQVEPEVLPGTRGSSSGHYIPEGQPGGQYFCLGVMATTFDPFGGTEGLLHETGHIRLHCAGIDLETHDGVLLDHSLGPDHPPEELFVSPVRRDCKRPIGAVLHAQYSYVMLSAFDLLVDDPVSKSIYLNFNIPRIEEGFDTLAENVRPTPGAGEDFIQSFQDWSREVITEGRAWLDEHPSPVPGHEPMPAPTA